MTQLNSANLNPSTSQLGKLKSGIKNIATCPGASTGANFKIIIKCDWY